MELLHLEDDPFEMDKNGFISENDKKKIVHESFFAFNKNICRNAYLNWNIDSTRNLSKQLYELSFSFFDTAANILLLCLNSNEDSGADNLIFSILFNFTHGMELGLKAIEIASRSSTSSTSIPIKPFGGHDMESTLKRCKQNLVGEINNNAKCKQAFDVLTNILPTLKKYYKFPCECFRYPIDKNGQQFSYTSPLNNETVDMEKFFLNILDVSYATNYIFGLIDPEYNL